MKQKGFANILIIIVGVVVLAGVSGYFVWLEYGPQPCAASLRPAEAVNKKTGEKKIFEYPCAVPRGWVITDYHPATTPQPTPSPTPVSKTFSESEIIASLKTNWQSIQASVPFRPAYHNQVEDAKKIWRTPTVVQFIGKNNILVRFEDDNNAHVAVFNFNGSKFSFSEVFKNQSEFTLSDWQNLVNKYGNSSYSVGTYTTDLIRNKQIVSFPDLTKVSENIFVKNYWEN